MCLDETRWAALRSKLRTVTTQGDNALQRIMLELCAFLDTRRNACVPLCVRGSICVCAHLHASVCQRVFVSERASVFEALRE